MTAKQKMQALAKLSLDTHPGAPDYYFSEEDNILSFCNGWLAHEKEVTENAPTPEDFSKAARQMIKLGAFIKKWLDYEQGTIDRDGPYHCQNIPNLMAEARELLK